MFAVYTVDDCDLVRSVEPGRSFLHLYCRVFYICIVDDCDLGRCVAVSSWVAVVSIFVVVSYNHDRSVFNVIFFLIPLVAVCYVCSVHCR